VPLPKAQLGAAAAGLQIAESSGPQSNGAAVAGYQLGYGSLFLANPGLDEVETSVNEYKTAHAAKRALAKEKKEALRSLARFAGLTQLNLTITGAPLSVPEIGHTHWAMLEAFSVVNHSSAYVVGVEFRHGKYVLTSVAIPGSQQLAESYAAAKARALDKRLHLGLNGRLHGRPVALPKHPKPGPPASGADPATAVLQTSDLPGSVITDQGYSSFDVALSEYDVSFEPAGSFDVVHQSVMLMPGSSSAAFVAAFIGAIEFAFLSGAPGSAVVTPVDVSAVGDEAQAEIVSTSGLGATNVTIITLDRGAVGDIVFAQSAATIDATAVQALAQSAATRLDAAIP